MQGPIIFITECPYIFRSVDHQTSLSPISTLIEEAIYLLHSVSVFVGRVSITQSGSLNLFSSKEQELEQRAQMLKRLAFTIFCSEPDQYQKSMPDIQGKHSTTKGGDHLDQQLSAIIMIISILVLFKSFIELMLYKN